MKNKEPIVKSGFDNKSSILLKLVMMKMTCSVKANRPTNHRSQDQILISSMVMTLRIKSLLNRQRLKRLEIQLVFHINVTNVTI